MKALPLLTSLLLANGEPADEYARALTWCLDDDDTSVYRTGDDDGAFLATAILDAAALDRVRERGLKAD